MEKLFKAVAESADRPQVRFEAALGALLKISEALPDAEFRSYLTRLVSSGFITASYRKSGMSSATWILLGIYRITRARFADDRTFVQSSLWRFTETWFKNFSEQREQSNPSLATRAFLNFRFFQDAQSDIEKLVIVKSMLSTVAEDSFFDRPDADDFLHVTFATWLLTPNKVFRRNTADFIHELSLRKVNSGNLVGRRIAYFVSFMSAGILGLPFPETQVFRPLDMQDFETFGTGATEALQLYESVLKLFYPISISDNPALEHFKTFYKIMGAELDSVVIRTHIQQGLLPSFSFITPKYNCSQFLK